MSALAPCPAAIGQTQSGMLLVHTRTLEPLSRAVRLALGEKRAVFHTREAAPFDIDPALQAVANDGLTPVLVDDSWGHGATIGEAMAIFEYLEDILPTPPLLPGGPLERAAVRAMAIRATRALGPIVDVVVTEKAQKILSRGGSPDTGALRRAANSANELLDQIGRAADAEGWVCGKKLSLADMVIAAHFSVLDFLDAVSWDVAPSGKNWYARLKQRPTFKTILADSLAGVTPPPHYGDLDF